MAANTMAQSTQPLPQRKPLNSRQGEAAASEIMLRNKDTSAQ